MLFPCLSRMDEIVAVYFIGELIEIMVAGHIAHCDQQEGQCGETLLPVDEMERRVLSRLRKAGYEHKEAHEMVAALIGLANFTETVPQLLPLRRLPTVVPLEHRNDVLAGRVKYLPQSFDGWLHVQADLVS